MLDILTIAVTPIAQNCRILSDMEHKLAVVVDAGGDVTILQQALEQLQVKCKAILLTHGHHDHVGGASALAKICQCPIIGPCKEDIYLFDKLQQQAKAFMLEPCEPFYPEFVEDGQILNILPEVSFEVIATPGHTPGGVCYYCKEENFVLTGDTLFSGSIGRTDFEGGNFDDIIKSIKTRLYCLPDNTEVFAGHGDDSTILIEKQSNPFVRM